MGGLHFYHPVYSFNKFKYTRVDQKILRILLPSQNRIRQEFENGVRLWGKGSRTLG
jgi:hypothetical protein